MGERHASNSSTVTVVRFVGLRENWGQTERFPIFPSGKTENVPPVFVPSFSRWINEGGIFSSTLLRQTRLTIAGLQLDLTLYLPSAAQSKRRPPRPESAPLNQLTSIQARYRVPQ